MTPKIADMVEKAVRQHYGTRVELMVLAVLDVATAKPDTIAELRRAMLSEYEQEIQEAIARAAHLVEQAGLS